ncbi:hypothetical protein Q4I32_003218 [Leishmania shawi]|uniref:Uncharacterized protein n=1 Tax=Leishmania shawi TaxID=5680 RepID=A0AAW3BXG3_9TRYP
MTSTQRVRDFAGDILAFHETHHDALKGTLERDLHGNLPRHLHSEILQENTAPSRPPTTGTPRSSSYRTPQWAELSECLREVSLAPLSDADAPRVAESRAVPLSRSSSTTTSSLPEYQVVKRLADLSQACDVDPEAVAAALQEAEKVLEAPTDAGRDREYAPRGSATAAERSAAKARLPLGGVQVTSASVAHSEEDLHSRRPRHHHHHRRRQDDHCGGSCTRSPDRVATAARLGATSGCHCFFPWGWPTLPCPVRAGTNISADNHANLHMSSGTAEIIDPAMRWYDVYYAWMLYYQQLYAIQVLQGRQQQCAKHGKRQSCRIHHGRHGDSHTASSGPEVLAGDQEDGTRCVHVERHSRAAAQADRGDVAQGGGSGVAEASPLMNTQPIFHHCPVSPQKPRTQTCTPRALQVSSEKTAKRDDEAARLRAELRHLKEEYAALSSCLVDLGGEGRQFLTCGDRRVRHSATASVAGAILAEPHPARPPAPVALRAKGGKRFGSRDDADPMSHYGSLAPAETWQSLSERQRSKALSPVPHVRTGRGSSPQRFSHQRPQWRH